MPCKLVLVLIKMSQKDKKGINYNIPVKQTDKNIDYEYKVIKHLLHIKFFISNVYSNLFTLTSHAGHDKCPRLIVIRAWVIHFFFMQRWHCRATFTLLHYIRKRITPKDGGVHPTGQEDGQPKIKKSKNFSPSFLYQTNDKTCLTWIRHKQRNVLSVGSALQQQGI